MSGSYVRDPMTRFLTYNVRHGQGVLSPVSLSRTARTIASLEPDVVVVNELYRWPGRYDQPASLARLLGMEHLFQVNTRFGLVEYGNAILSRWPLELVAHVALPRRREARGLLIASVALKGARALVGATHLALHRQTRAEQLGAIAAALALQPEAPRVLCGDFNCGPGELGPVLDELRLNHDTPPTYPSLAPLARLDHILWSDHWDLRSMATARGLASDHLPLYADLALRD